MILDHFYILDLETTGLEKNSKILSIGVYAISKDEMTLSWTIRTDIPCPPKHISYEHLKDTGIYSESVAIQVLLDIINNPRRHVMGWGIFYEIGVLKRYGVNLRKWKTIDLMIQYRKLLKHKKNSSLEFMCKRYNVTGDFPLHTALGDVDRTFKLYRLLRNKRV